MHTLNGEVIRAKIKSSGMTLEDAAVLLDMTRQTLHRHLERRTLSADFKEKVLQVLGKKIGLTGSTATSDFASGDPYEALRCEIVQKNKIIENLLDQIELLKKQIPQNSHKAKAG